jgi:hypothetical protein
LEKSVDKHFTFFFHPKVIPSQFLRSHFYFPSHPSLLDWATSFLCNLIPIPISVQCFKIYFFIWTNHEVISPLTLLSKFWIL